MLHSRFKNSRLHFAGSLSLAIVFYSFCVFAEQNQVPESTTLESETTDTDNTDSGVEENLNKEENSTTLESETTDTDNADSGVEENLTQEENLIPDESDEDEDWLGSLEMHFHGFASQGYMHSTANNYRMKTEDGTFNMTELGLNISTNLSDRLRIGMQLFAQTLGEVGEFDIVLDWGYFDYLFADWLGVRAGRIKVAHGLYNELARVDSGQVSVLMPQAIYSFNFFGLPADVFLTSLNGVSVYGNFSIGALGGLEYQAFVGALNTFSVIAFQGEAEARSKRFEGGALTWVTPLPGLRLGGSMFHCTLSLSASLGLEEIEQMESLGILPENHMSELRFDTSNLIAWVAFIEYNDYGFLLAAEYSRWTGKFTGPWDDFTRLTGLNDERFYVQLAYRFTEWFQLGTYYSVFFPYSEDRKGKTERFSKESDAWWKDLSLTLRFDINEYWLVKLEGHYMDGTAVIYSYLNPDENKIEEKWGLFMVKTTVSF
ncbi:MAG: hypothetical protein GY847_07115 [Proteobacteria bacterium]|nr:hypothetical protein [Pseudomonadota bacterium]